MRLFDIKAWIGKRMHKYFIQHLGKKLSVDYQVFDGPVRMPWIRIGTGDRETIVFLHGFSDRKEGFYFAAQTLAKDFDLIIPDMPGFGETEQDASLTYDLELYEQAVGAFIDHLAVPRFHLMGNSLGGAIAAVLATSRADRLLSLGLMDAAGFLVDGYNQLYEQLLRGENLFLVENAAQYEDFKHQIFFEPLKVPGLVNAYLAQEAIRNRLWYQKIFEDVLPIKSLEELETRGKELALNQYLPKLDMPILLLWGEKDRLFPVEIAQALHQQLPNSQLEILIGTGHCPHLEAPVQLAERVRGFLRE